MNAKLYVVPGSHPCAAVEGMLRHKGIAYRRIDLVHVAHRAILRMAGFSRGTVPALVLTGRKVSGSRAIARLLEELSPAPPLFPSDAVARAAVEEAERWGDEELQPVPRKLSWWILRRDTTHAGSFLSEARLPIPVGMAIHGLPLVARLAVRINGASDEAVRAALAALPGMMARVADLVKQGVLGGAAPNAADFQIAASVRLLGCFDDLAPWIDGTPAMEHAARYLPRPAGRMGAVLPREWLPEEIRAAAAGAAR